MNTQQYKELLDLEVLKIQDAINSIDKENQEIVNVKESDFDLVADQEEELETNAGIKVTLEERLEEVKDALARIENNTYGICVICRKDIEGPRLDTNPAATTCLSCL